MWVYLGSELDTGAISQTISHKNSQLIICISRGFESNQLIQLDYAETVPETSKLRIQAASAAPIKWRLYPLL